MFAVPEYVSDVQVGKNSPVPIQDIESPVHVPGDMSFYNDTTIRFKVKKRYGGWLGMLRHIWYGDEQTQGDKTR